MKSLAFALAAFLALGAGLVRAAEEKPASQPSSQPAAGAVVEVTDLETIKASVGKELRVHGKVSGTNKSRSGSILFINFEGVKRDFTAIVEKANMEAVNAGLGGDVEKTINGKTITVSGTIKLYREKPEIVISKPEQIEVDEEQK